MVFLSKLRWSPKKNNGYLDTDFSAAFQKQRKQKRKKGLSGHAEHFTRTKRKTYKITQKFDVKLPKKYKTARNFARNFDTLNQAGGQCPPPTPLSLNIVIGYRRLLQPFQTLLWFLPC